MIKARFENIGPIKSADLELGDLTVIAGQNNTGKTYLAYTLYEFLKLWGSDFPFYKIYDYPKEYNQDIKRIVQQIEETGAGSTNVERYKEMRSWLVNIASKFFSNEIIHQSFASPKSEFKNARFKFQSEANIQAIENMTHIRSGKDRVSMKSVFQDNNLVFELDSSAEVPPPRILGGLYTLFEKMAQDNTPDPFILSAERFGISLFYKELDFSRNRLVEKLQNWSGDKKDLDPFEFLESRSARYARPISDNIDFTRDLAHIQKQKGSLEEGGHRLIREIMKGQYKVVKDEIRFISTLRKENRFDIPIRLASSSARGLSDLYFYLKHVAAPGQLLIIDEPEGHLSPANQIMMARLLVFCVNAGLKVLITTHSDYIIKEIDNLIMLHSDFEQKQEFLKKHKKDYTENDRLDSKSVRAYICENGGLRGCAVDKRGIDNMTVFDDTINSINRVSAELDRYMDTDVPADD